ncbi:MAG: hypothetical protein Ct9H300mP1_00140 [Planctomycetaceae bacterium]|nr:MAG: hypothetical protein Ct9H300mP1_00140 [Planctomycetaceae bacterium]
MSPRSSCSVQAHWPAHRFNHLARLQQPRLIVMSVEEISRDTEVESLGPLTISLTEPDADTPQLLAA